MIIDAKNAVLGRLASFAAKKLVAGEEVTIINAEKAIVTGDPKVIFAKYLKMKQIGSPQHGPFFPKRPDMIVRRTIRGMLSKEKKGRAAFKRLKVYTDAQGMSGENIAVKTIKSKYITVGEIGKLLGWGGK